MRQQDGERETVRQVIASGQRIRARVRGAKHRLFDGHAGEMRTDLHRRSRLDVSRMQQHAFEGGVQQMPGTMREHVRQRGPPHRDRRLDGMRDGIESGHGGDVMRRGQRQFGIEDRDAHRR